MNGIRYDDEKRTEALMGSDHEECLFDMPKQYGSARASEVCQVLGFGICPDQLHRIEFWGVAPEQTNMDTAAKAGEPAFMPGVKFN